MTTPEQDIGALKADMKNVKDDLAEVKGDVREMRDILLRAQGGWKTLVIFGTVIAGITATLTKVIAWVWPFAQKQ